jgi:paraquat-inducible protein A
MDAREEVVCCPTCGLVQEAEEAAPPLVVECARCGSTIRERKTESLVPTVALALAALILYVPANVYPILRLERYGLYTENTVWQGVAELARLGYWFVATIVFCASIAVPLLKLAGLFYLAISAQLRTRRARRFRTRLYRLIDIVGPWAMLDVFLLAVLVALVRLGQLATVLPGRGLFAFTGVVVLTILATALFDPRLIWRGR